MKCLWNKSQGIRVRWRFTSERERIGDAFPSLATSSSIQCNFRRLRSSIFPARVTAWELTLRCSPFVHTYRLAPASNFNRVSIKDSVSQAKERMFREMEKFYWSQLLWYQKVIFFCGLILFATRKLSNDWFVYILSDISFYNRSRLRLHI